LMSQLPGQAANRLHQTGCHRSGSASEWQLWSRPDVDHSPNQLSAVHPNRSFNGTCVDEGHLPPRRGPASGCYARSELELPTHIGHAAAEIARPTAAIRSITATALPRKRGTALTRLACAATIAHRRQCPTRRRARWRGLVRSGMGDQGRRSDHSRGSHG
jgi:hypothetical protein